MSETQKAFHLRVLKGPDEGKTFELSDGDNLIGRWDTDSACFPEVDLEEIDRDFKVSRRHAVLDIDDGKVLLRDVGSLNGSKLNGEKLKAEEIHELKEADLVTIGNLEFVFEVIG